MNAVTEILPRSSAAVASIHACDVDMQGRFPTEAIASLKQDHALSAMIPLDMGGAGETITELARRCHTLGQSCASTAMVFAMHQIQIACLVGHHGGDIWLEHLMHRIAIEQLLMASVTSEVGVGGNIRNSLCAVERNHDQIRVYKKSTAISYGQEAGVLAITARRGESAAKQDQVLVFGLAGQYHLERTGTWDTMGMRGTCSHPFEVTLSCGHEQILQAPYGEVAEQTMQPVSHLLWCGVWTGIAADAVFRARAFVRARARGGVEAPSAPRARLADAVGIAQMMEGRLSCALRDFDAAWKNGPQPLTIQKTTDLNTLKVSISEQAIRVVNHALIICGIEGYKNNTPFSVGRHLRDLHSAPLMISNERMRENTGNLLMMQKPMLGAL